MERDQIWVFLDAQIIVCWKSVIYGFCEQPERFIPPASTFFSNGEIVRSHGYIGMLYSKDT